MKKILLLSAVLLSLLPVSFVRAQMRITEYMYQGANGEFIEFTNVGNAPIDLTGWSSDDNNRTPGVHSLSSFGVVQPGESVILTEANAGAFRTAWGLCNGIKIIGGISNDNLGRADEINLYDASNTLVDRLTYDDQTLGNPRTQNKSAWVRAAGLGANLASQWTLSALSDAEASYASTGADIGSPGKSTRATVSFNPCTVVNGAPTIVIDVLSTTNFLDGGATVSPLSPYGISGVISDPTDPAKFQGIDFTIGDDATAVASLTVTATSSNTTVVPNAGISLTGSNASRNLKITPAAVGYSNITVTVNDGTNSTSYIISYAASAAAAVPADTRWHTGISDASAAIALDDNYYIAGDDEQNVLNVYARSASGLPLVSYNYTSSLALPDPAKPEVDVEAATPSTSISNRIYWLGSMSNGKEPFDNKPNRNRLFATTVSGTGAATSFSFAGYYGNLRATLIAWGDANGYNFTASAAAGVDSKSPAGFAAEGMVFGPDNTTLYIGLRAPLVPVGSRTKAVIAPIMNFESWFNNGAPSGDPVFGAPIELNLGGRGIRDLIRLSNGTYIILSGNAAADPVTGALYKWTGNVADTPVLISSPASDALNMESAMQVNESGQLSLTRLQVITDKGADVLYNDGSEAKDLQENFRKFRLDDLSGIDLAFCQPTQGDTTVIACDSFAWYGNIYTSTPAVAPVHTLINAGGCDSTVTLHLVVNHSSASTSTVTACNSYRWNDSTYTASGTYIKTGLVNATGCDSTATLILTINNCNPIVTITSPVNGSSYPAGSTISLNATATDSDGSIVKVEFYNFNGKFAEDSTSPYQLTGQNVEPGDYALTAKAFDNNGNSTVSDTVKITVTSCAGSGSLSGYGYTGIPGNNLINLGSNINYPNNPDIIADLPRFEYGPNVGDNYGARLRGYICAPQTGNYIFYISSDEQSELWLSTDDNPANIRRIAYVETRTGFRSWFVNQAQRSVSIRLTKGARYYVETVHKEGTGTDHLSVSWLMPNGAFEGPIPGSRLSPWETPAPPVTSARPGFEEAMRSVAEQTEMIKGLQVMATPNPSPGQFTLKTRSNSEEKLIVTITDALGRVVEKRTAVPANGTLQIGNRLQPGLYFVEVLQGQKRERLKLVRQ